MSVFWTILTKLIISWIINEIDINILIIVYGWMHNAQRIPKIYNIVRIWWKEKKLLIVKPIAVLRQDMMMMMMMMMMMKWNKKRWGAQDIWLPVQLFSLPAWQTEKLLKILQLSWIINWMDIAPRITTMYKFSCIWWTHSTFLSIKTHLFAHFLAK